MSLEGKTVILFGAGAIASGYAPLFADKAENVIIVSRGDSCERVTEKVRGRPGANIAGEVMAVHADAAVFAQVGKVYDDAVDKFGSVDVVVNGSGGNRPEAVVSSLDEFIAKDPAVAAEMMAANYLSKQYSLQHFARVLRDGGYEGSAVNITSMAGFQPFTKVIDYSAAFAAIENLTSSIAHLFAVARIGRVNNLAVGFTIGEQNRRLLLNEDGSPTPRAREILDGTSQGRFLDVEEIGPHVLYLADSDRSGPVNGHALRVDGGYNLVNTPVSSGYGPK